MAVICWLLTFSLQIPMMVTNVYNGFSLIHPQTVIHFTVYPPTSTFIHKINPTQSSPKWVLWGIY